MFNLNTNLQDSDLIIIPIVLILMLFVIKNEFFKKISLYISFVILVIVNEHISTLFKSMSILLLKLNFFVVETFFKNFSSGLKIHYEVSKLKKKYIIGLFITMFISLLLLIKIKGMGLEDKFLYHLELIDNRAFLISSFLIILYIIAIKLREVKCEQYNHTCVSIINFNYKILRR